MKMLTNVSKGFGMGMGNVSEVPTTPHLPLGKFALREGVKAVCVVGAGVLIGGTVTYLGAPRSAIRKVRTVEQGKKLRKNLDEVIEVLQSKEAEAQAKKDKKKADKEAKAAEKKEKKDAA